MVVVSTQKEKIVNHNFIFKDLKFLVQYLRTKFLLFFEIPESLHVGRCEVGVVVWRWCCSAHTGNEVSSAVWRKGREGVVCILAFVGL